MYISKGPANLQPKPEKRRNKDINGQENNKDLECVNDTISHFRSARLFLMHKKQYPLFFPLFLTIPLKKKSIDETGTQNLHIRHS